MKRIIAIILSMIFFIMLVGCTEKDDTNENSSTAETTITETIYKAETVEEPTENKQLSEIEVLSEDDKAVKAEIAKYSETTIDFKNLKQENFEGKNYDLTFSKMGSTTEASVYSNITYTDNKGDEFSYDLATGKLVMINLSSLKTEKTAESIDILSAETIAYEFASKNCSISDYALTSKEERENGYMFTYCKYIYGYQTNDRVKVLVGFDGAIIWTAIRVYPIDNDEVNVNEFWFESKINEIEEKHQNIDIEKAWIERNRQDRKIYFNVQYKTSDTNGNISASVAMFEIK